MATVIFNPTNEDLSARWEGIDYTIPKHPEKGHISKYDDKLAKALINKLSSRGLTTLEFGDDANDGKIKKEKARAGRQANKDFKGRQVAKYNADNEARKMRSLEYIEPPEQVKQYAIELGIDILKPYEVKDVHNTELSKLRDEKDALLKSNAEMMETMKAMMKALNEKGVTVDTAADAEAKRQKEIKDTIEIFNYMQKGEYEAWVTRDLNRKDYYGFPVEVQDKMRDKWERFWTAEEKPYPL